MTNSAGPPGAGQPSEDPDPRALARDWIDLWQSELSALTVDRELREHWQEAIALWAGMAASIIQGMPRQTTADAAAHNGAGRHTSPDDAPRATTAPAAPDARDAEIERLGRDLATLEARLAELEGRRAPRRNRKRKA